MPWPEVLADMERRVAAAEQALRQGGAPPSDFCRPEDLGPLPSELVDRARRIQSDTTRVAAQVSTARELVAGALCRPRERAAQAPSYFDTRL